MAVNGGGETPRAAGTRAAGDHRVERGPERLGSRPCPCLNDDKRDTAGRRESEGGPTGSRSRAITAVVEAQPAARDTMARMDFRFAFLAALFGGSGVALGAFGAHAMQQRVTPDLLAVFETGVRYQMYHALALLGVALAANRLPESALLYAAGWLFVLGILVFSGSLYALVFSGVRTFGAITPIGGVAFLAGWTCFGLACFRGL